MVNPNHSNNLGFNLSADHSLCFIGIYEQMTAIKSKRLTVRPRQTKFFCILEVAYQRILTLKQYFGNALFTISSLGRVLIHSFAKNNRKIMRFGILIRSLIRPRIKKLPKRSNSELTYFCRAFFDAKGKIFLRYSKSNSTYSLRVR